MLRSPRSSPERRRLPALLLAGAVLLGAAPAGALPEAAGLEEVSSTAREVLKDPRFQREMPPHSQPAGAGDPGSDFQSGQSGPGGGPSNSVALPALGAGAELGKLVFLVLLAVAVVLLGVWITGAAVRRRRASPVTGAAEGAPEAGGAPRREPVFDDAARLAAEGRYAEAVHALLLAAIRHFAERSRVSIQPSRTSRELVRLLPLGPEAREAFAELVRRVELSLFGGAPVDREDYERSLSRFQDLTRRPS